MRAERLLLEYDDERSGSFEPLRDVPDEKFVVLGLISTKKPQMESLNDLERKISDADRYISRERLGLSPQCGFASSIVGNNLSFIEQQAKLKLVVDTARAIWG
ncbi:MAG TPA: vitamin-B12 independent methionine synthase [Candidatus Binatia bacterium]|jgi:5-methyltetrahydropteroyltriglutamate--homocysteine methyltransferase